MALDPDRVVKPVLKLRKAIKQFPKTPDPELVHDVRTRSRRVEAMLDALAAEAGRNEQQLLRVMARVRKRAGKVRDMDALTGYAANLQVDGEQDCRVQLLEFLGAKRYRYARSMHAEVRRDGPELRRRLKRLLAWVERLVDESGKSPSASNASVEIAAVALRLSAELREPARLNKSNLHPYRLKVKRLQYVLEMAGDQDPERQRLIEKLKELKDAAGEWHDWEELIGFAEKALGEGKGRKLLREMQTIAERNYERALSLAQELRKTYLGEPAKGLRRSGRSARARVVLAPPVVKAVSAVAA